jgi:hypothetical protein
MYPRALHFDNSTVALQLVPSIGNSNQLKLKPVRLARFAATDRTLQSAPYATSYVCCARSVPLSLRHSRLPSLRLCLWSITALRSIPKRSRSVFVAAPSPTRAAAYRAVRTLSRTAAQVLDPKFSDEELSAARTQIKNELDDLNKRPEVNAETRPACMEQSTTACALDLATELY